MTKGRTQVDQWANSLKDGAVVFLVCAMVLAVVGATLPSQVLVSARPGHHEDSGAVNLLMQAISVEDDAGGMGRGSLPWSEQASHLEAVLILPGANYGQRTGAADVSHLVCRAEVVDYSDDSNVCATSSGVSTSLGRLFTLVGAKPSGTS